MALKIAVLASTRASDMQGIIDAIKRGYLNAEIKILFSNRKESYALERAKNNGIECLFIDSAGLSREEYDEKIIKELKKRDIELILLIGYMKILSKKFIDAYKFKIMNIHPSLLPAFAGGMDKNVHKAVLDYGCKITGCTLHFADESVDGGPIIIQKVCEVEDTDNENTLKEKVQNLEVHAFIEAIKLFSENKIKVEGRNVKLLK
ncbi:MAG: phosphoribosylglycinamide formyltransferase [Candidatus Altiarchaeales archaeon HGW-Altiarchaeales-1]|nr:MAG: phosphoribosylglycinamide formyltransferase [Candidatus Altiarchaeales archaeon HGW-Altiarchaeales-1]